MKRVTSGFGGGRPPAAVNRQRRTIRTETSFKSQPTKPRKRVTSGGVTAGATTGKVFRISWVRTSEGGATEDAERLNGGNG